jgi:hypothetical protein
MPAFVVANSAPGSARAVDTCEIGRIENQIKSGRARTHNMMESPRRPGARASKRRITSSSAHAIEGIDAQATVAESQCTMNRQTRDAWKRKSYESRV